MAASEADLRADIQADVGIMRQCARISNRMPGNGSPRNNGNCGSSMKISYAVRAALGARVTSLNIFSS
jgi:hypothetical protein